MKKIKKILSAVLCLVLVLTLTVPAFASEEAIKCPTVYVPGIASSYIYTDINEPSERIDEVDKEAVTAMIRDEIVPALIVYAADGDEDKLAHKISEAVNGVFEDWFNNPDGTPVGDAGAINTYPDVISENSRLVFRYDWRGDPIVLAAQLNDYIDYVTKTAGTDKVALTSHSLGSVVILAYLSLYGYDKVAGIVLDSPVIDGVAYLGDLLCGETEITAQAFSLFFKGVMGATEYEDLVSSSLEILELSDVPELASDFLDNIFEKIGPVFFRETLVPLFGHWLTIWAMTPESKVEQAVEFVFGNSEDEDTLALKNKIESYNSLVRKDRKETLLNFDKQGRIAIISRYGFSSLPVTSSWELLGDSVIETKSSALGATTSIVGECLSDEYLEDKDMKYISPDKTIDASTCLFPEKTWFVKNLLHTEAGVTGELQRQLLFGEEEATCDNSSVPRFTVYDYETQSFNTDDSVPAKAEKTSPLQKLFNFLAALFDRLISFFTGKI